MANHMLGRFMDRPEAAAWLPRLHTVRVVNVNTPAYEAQDMIAFFQWLLSVQRILLLWGWDPDMELRPIPPLDARGSTAGNLPALSVSRARAKTIPKLQNYLSLNKALRTFVLDLQNHPEYNLPIDSTLMQKGLEHMRSSLKHLVLRLEIYDFPGDQIEASATTDVFTGSLSFLRDFTALTTLETSLPMLFGDPKTTNRQRHILAEVLPPNLERLTNTDDLWYVIMFAWTTTVGSMEVFKQLFNGEMLDRTALKDTSTDNIDAISWIDTGAGAWKDATPELREFVFDIRTHVSISDYWCRESVRDELREACESQGIKRRILHN